MKRSLLCVAAMLLASGAWGQQRIGEPEHVCRWVLKGGGYEYNACPPAKQEKKAPPDDRIRACEYENAGLPCLIGRLPTTFDVPPKEWDGPDTIGSQIGEETHGDGICMDTMGDIKCDEKIHHRTCTDKKRVLLMSEDGKWHCYDFGRLEESR